MNLDAPGTICFTPVVGEFKDVAGLLSGSLGTSVWVQKCVCNHLSAGQQQTSVSAENKAILEKG